MFYYKKILFTQSFKLFYKTFINLIKNNLDDLYPNY